MLSHIASHIDSFPVQRRMKMRSTFFITNPKRQPKILVVVNYDDISQIFEAKYDVSCCSNRVGPSIALSKTVCFVCMRISLLLFIYVYSLREASFFLSSLHPIVFPALFPSLLKGKRLMSFFSLHPLQNTAQRSFCNPCWLIPHQIVLDLVLWNPFPSWQGCHLLQLRR